MVRRGLHRLGGALHDMPLQERQDLPRVRDGLPDKPRAGGLAIAVRAAEVRCSRGFGKMGVKPAWELVNPKHQRNPIILTTASLQWAMECGGDGPG